MTTTHTPRTAGYLRAEDCHLDDLLALIGASTDLADYPHAAEVSQGVLVYHAPALRDAMTDDHARRAVHVELSRALADGPGIAVFRGAFESTAWRGGLPPSTCDGFPAFPYHFVNPTAFINARLAPTQPSPAQPSPSGPSPVESSPAPTGSGCR
jgi:hypothetical protein